MTELRARGFSNINQGVYAPAATAARTKTRAEKSPVIEPDMSVVSTQAHSLKTSNEHSEIQLNSAGKNPSHAYP